MIKNNRPIIPYGNDFSLAINMTKYDATQDDYIDFDMEQVTDLRVFLTCSNNNTTIPLDYTLNGNLITCKIQYRYLAPQVSYGIVVEGNDENQDHFRFEMLPREGFLVVSNTSGTKLAENIDIIDIKARVGWGNTIDAYTKEEIDEMNADLQSEIDAKQDELISGTNIKTINNESIVGGGNIVVGEADYSKEYFTIESLADNNDIVFTPVNGNVLSYSVNKGEWVEGNEVTVNKGDNVRWKGELIPDTDKNFSSGIFTSTENINVKGNIMSLKHGDDFEGKLTISDGYLFAKLFQGCTKLIDAHNLILPATRLSEESYSSMFTGCTSLVEAPKLPATRLALYCYENMFQDCASLTEAPELPAIYLEKSCYENMFAGCTSLIKAPELHATRLTSYCYENMFSGCSKLSYVKMLATQILSSLSLNNWMSGVASSGTMITSGKVTLIKNSINGIPTGWTELQYSDPAALAAKQDVLVSGTNIKTINNESILGEGNITIEGGGGGETGPQGPQGAQGATGPQGSKGDKGELLDYATKYLTIKSLANNNTITFTPKNSNTFEYSLDNGSTWIQYSEPITLNAKEEVLLKARFIPIQLSSPDGGSGTFSSTGSAELSGNIMSLQEGDNFINVTTLNSNYIFSFLFNGWTTLVNANNLILPATTLTTGCYLCLLRGCSNLVSAPKLPAMIATTRCYGGMFENCTSLPFAPELPATTLGNNCYEGMFNGCSQLRDAPELPATTLTQNCYASMFARCTNLIKAPRILPAINVASVCYGSMFSRCINLETGPTILAKNLSSCQFMFEECSKLKYIELLATEGGLGINFLSGVPRGGIIVTSGLTSYTIPSGWTELIYTSKSTLNAKQDALVSGTNIKTINNESILGSGNIVIEGGGGGETGPQGAQGAQGPQGEQGPQGPAGDAAAGGDPGFIKVTNENNENNVGLVNSLSQNYDTNIGNYAIIFGDASSTSSRYVISASGNYAIAEGYETKASGYYSHAEGRRSKAEAEASHAEGDSTTASGYNSHAEGQNTTASGRNSHAEGNSTTASGNFSHAEGNSTTASGFISHAEGHGTTATNNSEHASGQYNVSNNVSGSSFGNSGNTLFSVGNGTDANNRHNAFEIRQNGDIYLNDGSHPISSTTNGLKIEVVSALPVSPDNSTIYIVQ